MKKIARISFSIALLTLGAPAYAGGEAYQNPGLSAYLAEKPDLPAPPKLEFPSPQGVYFGVTGGAERIKSLKVENEFEREIPEVNSNKTLTQAGASIGYLFKEAGWFNQLEIQYLGRNKYNYTGTFRNLGVMDAHINIQTVMAKLYSTLNIGHHIFPYMYLGAGVAYTKAPATLTRITPNGSIQTIPLVSGSSDSGTFTQVGNDIVIIDNGQTIIVDNNDFFSFTSEGQKNSRSSFAASAGVGVRFRLSYQLMIDLNYEFAYLGRTQDWGIPLRNSRTNNSPLRLFSGSDINSQAISISILFQPWGYAADVE